MDNIAVKVIGYNLKTRWQITFSYLIPCIVELLVYITVMVVDIALIYQHFLDGNQSLALITLSFLIIPAFITFVTCILAPADPYSESKSRSIPRLFLIQFLYLMIFPMCALYRFSRKIFWCVESLFHEKNTYERHQAISKAAENSQFELYHFLQSFFHCAPQIIFQLYIILRNDMFRNYDTAFVQVLSIIFGLIKMSMSAESYQRFESQKMVGKSYPWQTMKQNIKFTRSVSATFGQTQNNPTASQNEIIPEEEGVVNNLDEKFSEEKGKIDYNVNITDDEKLNSFKNLNLSSDDDVDEVDSPNKILENNAELRNDEHKHNFHIDIRKSFIKPLDDTMHRLSALGNTMLLHTESFIKEKIPRAPKALFTHHNENELEKKAFTEQTTDEVDAFILPTRREIVAGIESDDIVAKFIAFLGWNFFLIMRLMSLSSFAVFHLDICGWLCFFHYCLMLLMLINETRFQVKWQRTAFYGVLAYIFIFNLIEFKVKFKQIRTWYILYFLLVIIQNISMTISWYCFEEFLDTWWFEFIFLVIVQSGIMSIMCFLLYFCYLKPKDKVLLT